MSSTLRNISLFLSLVLVTFATSARITYLQGDTNGDGEVNGIDVNTLISILLGTVDPSTVANPEQPKRIDVNGDGDINGIDINLEFNMILGKIQPEVIKVGPDVINYDYVWQDNSVPEIHIDFELDQWNDLLMAYDAFYGTKKYIVARNFTFKRGDEVTTLADVGFRLKGSGSRMRPEGDSLEMHTTDNTDWHLANFAINTRKYVDEFDHSLDGVRKLHLKWCFCDYTHVREKYCYDMFERFGVWTAPRHSYCHLWLHVGDDSYEANYGLYQIVEPIDKDYIKDRADHFGYDDGYLWKCRNIEGKGPASLADPDTGDIGWDDGDDYNRVYELQTNTKRFSQARVQLQHFMHQIIDLDDAEFYAWAEQTFDIDLLLRTYAVSVAVSQWDDYWNYGNNYYLYFVPRQQGNTHDPANYRVYMILYDYDNTLGTVRRVGVQTDAVTHDPLNWGNEGHPLISRILSKPEWRQQYIANLKMLFTKGKNLMYYSESATRIKAWWKLITPHADNIMQQYNVVKDSPANWSVVFKYRLLDTRPDHNVFMIKKSIIDNLE